MNRIVLVNYTNGPLQYTFNCDLFGSLLQLEGADGRSFVPPDRTGTTASSPNFNHLETPLFRYLRARPIYSKTFDIETRYRLSVYLFEFRSEFDSRIYYLLIGRFFFDLFFGFRVRKNCEKQSTRPPGLGWVERSIAGRRRDN